MKTYRGKKRKWLGESVDHFDRMIKKVRTYDSSRFALSDRLLDDIGENWSWQYCSLCRNQPAGETGCLTCPLHEVGHDCNVIGSLWCKINMAATWAGWLTPAFKMRNLMARMCGRKELQEKKTTIGRDDGTKYRGQFSIIDAFQITKDWRIRTDWPDWLKSAWLRKPGENSVWVDLDDPDAEKLCCGTFANCYIVKLGDWIVRGEGENGKFYSYRSDSFDAIFGDE